MKIFKFILNIVGLIGFGIALPLLWGWFIVPFGVIAITFWHALGLRMLIGLLIPSTSEISSAIEIQKKYNDENRLLATITFALLPYVTLAFGAIYHVFM